jgi:hypothetical protein
MTTRAALQSHKTRKIEVFILGAWRHPQKPVTRSEMIIHGSKKNDDPFQKVFGA